MTRRNIILSFIVVVFSVAAWLGYHEYNRKVKDLSGIRSEFTMDAGELITIFENDEAAANLRYLDKIIAVQGNLKTIEKGDQGNYSIVLGDGGGMSSVRCSMDSSHLHEIANLREGTMIIVKGACTGFNADELLGSDVILNRCVIEKTK